MNKGRAGEYRGSKEMDSCPLTHAVSDIYTTDHNRLPSLDCDAFGLTADVSGIKVWVIPLRFLRLKISCSSAAICWCAVNALVNNVEIMLVAMLV
jgi:hypothetical protein